MCWFDCYLVDSLVCDSGWWLLMFGLEVISVACGSLVWVCLWVLRFIDVVVVCRLLVGCCFVLALC